ncbi:hypothetical protein Dimus_024091, partial [Dionaea muscipula]
AVLEKRWLSFVLYRFAVPGQVVLGSCLFLLLMLIGMGVEDAGCGTKEGISHWFHFQLVLETFSLAGKMQISMESLPGLPALDDLVDVHGFTSLAWGRGFLFEFFQLLVGWGGAEFGGDGGVVGLSVEFDV